MVNIPSGCAGSEAKAEAKAEAEAKAKEGIKVRTPDDRHADVRLVISSILVRRRGTYGIQVWRSCRRLDGA